MSSVRLRAVKFFLGAVFTQILTSPGYADAILSPVNFASLGALGKPGVDQYFVGVTVTHGVDSPVIVDPAGRTLCTGVFIGNFFQGTRIAVFDFTSFTLNAGQTFSLTSEPNNILSTLSSPFALLSLTGMTIAATITARGGDGTQGNLTSMCNGCGLGGPGFAGGGDGGVC